MWSWCRVRPLGGHPESFVATEDGASEAIVVKARGVDSARRPLPDLLALEGVRSDSS